MADGSSGAVVLKACGLRYDPPSIVVEYVRKTSGQLRQRSIPVKNLRLSTTEIINDLRQRHRVYLMAIKDAQLERLVNKLRESPVSANQSAITVDEDLNKLDDESLQRHKKQMNTSFEAHRLKPGDPGYVYDVQKSFTAVETSGWDDEEEDDEDGW